MERRRQTGRRLRRVVLGGAVLLAGIGSSLLLPFVANAAGGDDLPPARFPTVPTLYRGDSRPPSEIFQNGFSGRGRDYNLVNHVHGGEAARNSAYISTSEDAGESARFARSQGLASNIEQLERQAIACRDRVARPRAPWQSVWTYFMDRTNPGCVADSQGRLPLRTYVYEIDPRYAGAAYHVPDLFQAHPELARFGGQREWAYRDSIPRHAIIRVQVFEAHVPVTFDSNGQPNFGNFRNQPGDWQRVPEQANQPQRNPYYGVIDYSSLTHGRGNGTGAGSSSGQANPRDHVGTSSHDELRRRRLAKEPGAANPYTRGCSAITRCRG
ncbi:hypothetical protein DMH04_50375 [Kibdelosporangium aridum]|uniref:Pertussis toxin, subunit 1 n=1 Tax=Kibdelosporangium aridum TaxID=2030 RepID=A0A428YBW6_KIBAR|nr:rapid alkalinization factor family protein [Kibdelosporangium aridum]RSM64970.1 hypothetical protein DMH04_50375 [Kibdelosporangium aridum]